MPDRQRLTVILATLGAVFAMAAPAQTRLSLDEAASRAGTDFNPAFAGKEVIVSGQVSSAPFFIAESYYLPVQDQSAHGLLLEGTAHQFDGLEPGVWVESKGTIQRRGGMPVLVPLELQKLSRAAAPVPKTVPVAELASFRYVGALVKTDSMVLEATGDLVTIGDRKNPITIVLPRARRDNGPRLVNLHQGDWVRVTGVASQSCALPPYDHFFEILVPTAASVVVLERAWMIPPPFLLAALLLAGVLLVIWWVRERRMVALRRAMRYLNTLGEEVIGATSPAEILRRLTLTLPQVSGVSGIGLYTYNRGAKTLESVHSSGGTAEVIELDAPRGPVAAGIAACFQSRAILPIPDMRRGPFAQKDLARQDEGPNMPRSMLLVPMFAQGDLIGIMELHDSDRYRYFSQSEQAAMQHLANQVATALRLQEQQSIREQLFRSEKLAAAGQLISDVASELRVPLEAIVKQAGSLAARHWDESSATLKSIASEARRASDIVSRLVSVAKVEQSEAHPVDLNTIISDLLKFRAPEWKGKGVEIRAQLAPKRATVMGSSGQLEQVLLNLLVDAEKSAVDTPEMIIEVSSSLLAKRVLVEIAYPLRQADSQRADVVDGDHAGSGALGLGVCRGIIQSHGGEFRVVRVSPTQARFDIELPVIETQPVNSNGNAGLPAASRQLTVLIVEPDAKLQRQLVAVLGNRGDRVVPVASAEEGADLVQRMRFDMAICEVRLPGLNWVEFFERVRYQVGGFVLLTDGFDNDLARAFQGGEGMVLSKPVEEAELHRICRIIEERAAVNG